MISLSDTLHQLQAIAPLELAAPWDNVGLLVEPVQTRPVRRVFLTIDLTQSVLDEALAWDSDLIVAYHPPVFQPLERLTRATPSQLLVLRCLQADVAVYSPHTALDAVPDGINDWLADGLGQGERVSLEPHPAQADQEQYKLVIFTPRSHVEALRHALSERAGAGVIGDYSQCSFNLLGQGTFLGGATTHPTVGEKGQLETVEEIRLEMVCAAAALARAQEVIRQVHPYETPAWEIYRLEPKPEQCAGQGRAVTLQRPVRLQSLVERIKTYLGLRHLRLAAAPRHRQGQKIQHVLLCPGAGGSVLSGRPADLYLTGEMRHHDVLAARERGTSVILTDHTHCERGYLPVLRKALRARLGREVQVRISRVDGDPLKIV